MEIALSRWSPPKAAEVGRATVAKRIFPAKRTSVTQGDLPNRSASQALYGIAA